MFTRKHYSTNLERELQFSYKIVKIETGFYYGQEESDDSTLLEIDEDLYYQFMMTAVNNGLYYEDTEAQYTLNVL